MLCARMSRIHVFCLAVLLLAHPLVRIGNSSGASKDFRANPERMEERIQALSQYGKNPEGGVSRVSFSEADRSSNNITAMSRPSCLWFMLMRGSGCAPHL